MVSLKDSEDILKQLNLDKSDTMEKQMLKELILEFIDVFKFPNQSLTCTTEVTHRIITKNVPAILKRPYRVPYHGKEILRNEINKLLEDRIILGSQSPWSL